METERTCATFSLPLGNLLPEVEEYQRMLRAGWVPLAAHYRTSRDPDGARILRIEFERIAQSILTEERTG